MEQTDYNQIKHCFISGNIAAAHVFKFHYFGKTNLYLHPLSWGKLQTEIAKNQEFFDNQYKDIGALNVVTDYVVSEDKAITATTEQFDLYKLLLKDPYIDHEKATFEQYAKIVQGLLNLSNDVAATSVNKSSKFIVGIDPAIMDGDLSRIYVWHNGVYIKELNKFPITGEGFGI